MPAYLSKGYQCKQCLPISPKGTNVNNACLPPQRISSHKISANLPKEYKVIQYLPTIPKEYKQYLPTFPKNTKSYNTCLPPQRIPSHKISAYLPKEYQVIQYLPMIPKEY